MMVSPRVSQIIEHCWSLQLNRMLTLIFRLHAANVLPLNMIIQILHDPPEFQFPQTIEHALRDQSLLKFLFQTSHSSELRIYESQWSLIPCFR